MCAAQALGNAPRPLGAQRRVALGYTRCDRNVAKVRVRTLLATVNYRLVTVLLGCPSLVRPDDVAEAVVRASQQRSGARATNCPLRCTRQGPALGVIGAGGDAPQPWISLTTLVSAAIACGAEAPQLPTHPDSARQSKAV